MLKLCSLLVPAYRKPNHDGQTPEMYSTGISQKWERELCQRAAGVMRQRMGEELSLHKGKGVVEFKPFLRYDFYTDTDTPALAEIISLALVTFDIKTITVIRDDAEYEVFDAQEAESLSLGAHVWSVE